MKKTLPWLISVGAALAVALAVALSFVITTERGSAWLLSLAPQLEVTRPTGRFFGGAFAAERVTVDAGGRAITLERLAWRDARWAWRPHPGAWVGLVIEGASAQTVRIGPAAATTSEPAQPPKTLRLPLALTLDGLRVGSLEVGGSAVLRDIDTRIELGHEQGRVHRVPAFAALSDRARLEGDARIDADAPFSTEATLRASSLDGAPRPWQASARATGPLAAVAVQAQLTSPQAAGASVQAQGTLAPFAAWPLSQLQLNARALDLAALWADAPQTQIDGDAAIDTRAQDQPITARIALTNVQAGRWNEKRLPLARVELDASARADQRDRLTLQRFELTAPNDGGRISGQGQWQAGTATVDLTLHALRPAALDARAPAMTLGGTLGARLLGLPSPDGAAPTSSTLQLQSRLALDGKLDARNAQPVRLTGALQSERSAEGWRVTLDDAQARAGDALLEASVSLDQRTNGASTLTTQGRAQGFDPAPWWPAAPSARVNGRWQAELQAPASWRFVADSAASWLALRGKVQLDVQDNSAVAGVPVGANVRADSAAGGGWSAQASAQAANNSAQVQGTLAPRADADRWRVELDAPALAALRPAIAAFGARAAALQGLEGAVRGQAQLEGRRPQLRSSGTLRADGVRSATVSAAQLDARWQHGADRNAPLVLDLDAQRLAFDAVRFDTLRSKVDGTLAAHRIDVDGASALRPPAWTDTVLGLPEASRGSALKLRGEGRWAAAANAPAGQWRARFAELDARGNGAAQSWLAARDLQLALSFDAAGRVTDAQAAPGRATVLGAPLVWREAQWSAATPNRAASLALDAQLEPMPIAPWLARWAPDAGFGGDLALKGSFVVRRGANVAADIVFERASGDLSVTTEGVTQTLGLTDLRLSLAANDGTWHFAQAFAGANAGVLAGAQSMRLSPQATWPAPDTPMQGVLEWGVADLGVWAPFTPPGWRVGGRLRTSAAIGGRFGAPEIEGRMEGSQLALRNLLQGVDLRDGQLALSLRGADAQIERFVFKGGDGELRLSGGATLGAEPKATLQLVADRFLLLGRSDRRIVSSGNATLALDAKSLAATGQFAVDEGLIDITSRDAPSLDSDVTVRGGRNAATRRADAEGNGDPSPAAPTRARSATTTDLRIGLNVDLGQRLRLRGRGIDTRLVGKLAATSPQSRLSLNGEVRTADGQYAAYGQKLNIERGIIAFSGAAENPHLDILAIRPNLDVEVGVQIEGTAQAPRVRLVSTPEMSEYDKLSWLVIGRAPEGLGQTDIALLQRAALALLAGEGQGLDAQLLGTLGIDEFSLRQVESGDVRETVVSLGKQLSRRWYVGYERSVNDTTGSWQLIYRAARRFTLRAQSGQDNSLDAIWTWRWN
jgi:translocation and assembly module TamB